MTMRMWLRVRKKGFGELRARVLKEHMDIEITKSYNSIENSNNEQGATPLNNKGCEQEVTDACNKKVSR